jgi:Rrf2 family transcriptional regulator, iron-sulfur cluster assembly transcription factor
MIFSRSVVYAIRAMTFLALQPAGKLSGAREIAEAETVPMQFLWKILQNLARRKLVRSFKGARGGYELAKPAENITVKDVVMAADENGGTEGCVLGLAACSEEKPCPLHHNWKRIRADIMEMQDKTTLADLADSSAGNSAK